VRSIKIKRELSLYQQIADQFEVRIVKRELKPGDKLPTEQELMEMLSVSRPTIREATKILRDRDLIEVRKGDGTYVKKFDIGSMYKPIHRLFESMDAPFHELMEIRQIFEPYIASKAAEKATSENLAVLQKAMHDMITTPESPISHWESDKLFHTELFKAAGNSMLLAIIEPVFQLMRQLVLEVSAYTFKVNAVSNTENHPFKDYHYEIIKAIKLHDSDRAEQLMRKHLVMAAKDVDTWEKARDTKKIMDTIEQPGKSN